MLIHDVDLELNRAIAVHFKLIRFFLDLCFSLLYYLMILDKSILVNGAVSMHDLFELQLGRDLGC